MNKTIDFKKENNNIILCSQLFQHWSSSYIYVEDKTQQGFTMYIFKCFWVGQALYVEVFLQTTIWYSSAFCCGLALYRINMPINS